MRLAPSAVVCLLLAGVFLATACSVDCLRLLAAAAPVPQALHAPHHHGSPACPEEHPQNQESSCATHGPTIDFIAAPHKLESAGPSLAVVTTSLLADPSRESLAVTGVSPSFPANFSPPPQSTVLRI